MDAQTRKTVDWPTAIGSFIGATLVFVTASLIMSFILSIAWNNGPAKLTGWPSMTWAESLATLVSIWVLASPIRQIRVAVGE